MIGGAACASEQLELAGSVAQVGPADAPAMPTSRTDFRPIRTCRVCDHAWRQKGDRMPWQCPSCKSDQWNGDETPPRPRAVNRDAAKCEHCGHEWPPRSDRPAKCPHCHRFDWDEPQTSTRPCKSCSKATPWPEGFARNLSYKSGRSRTCIECTRTLKRESKRESRAPGGARAMRKTVQRERERYELQRERDEKWAEDAFAQLRANREAVRG